MPLSSHISHLEHLLHPHEREHHAPEDNQQVLEVMKSKLMAFNVPRALWLFVFHEQARSVYEDLMWDFVGDPKQDDIAAHPEIATGEFFHRKHAFATNLGQLVVIRQRISEERQPSPSDFMVMTADMEAGTQKRHYVIGMDEQRERVWQWSNVYTVMTYALSEDPGASHVPVEELDLTRTPHLVVTTPQPRNAAAAQLNLGPDHVHESLGDIDFLPLRAQQFFNYFSHEDIERLGRLHEPLPAVLNELEPATIAS